jgi:hypothetical protein
MAIMSKPSTRSAQFNVITCGLQYGNRIRFVYHPSTGGDSAVSFVLDEKEALAVPRLYCAPLRDSRSNAD